MPRIRADTIVEHKRASRRALLDAAFELFVANGFQGTSLTDVASLAGVGRTTLYEYFSNKEELFLALAEERVPPLLKTAVAELAAGSPGQRMEGAFEKVFEVLRDNVGLARLLFVVGRELPAEARQRMWEVLWPINDELMRQCEIGIDHAVFSGDDPALLHRTVADLLVGAVEQLLRMGYSDELAAKVLQARIDFLRHGLALNSAAAQ